jgi:hypothetical protein
MSAPDAIEHRVENLERFQVDIERRFAEAFPGEVLRMNRRLFLLLPLAGCSTIDPWRTDYHPVASFKWKKTREVEEVTLIKIESEGAGQYCSELHKTPALACASEYGPKWQLFVPPDDPMILAHECLHALGYDHE